MLAVATLVVQMIRHRIELLYATTIFIRLFFLVVIAGLYLRAAGHQPRAPRGPGS